MTTEQAHAHLSKIRADVVRQLNECRREGGTPEMIAAIVEIGTALVNRVVALSTGEPRAAHPETPEGA